MTLQDPKFNHTPEACDRCVYAMRDRHGERDCDAHNGAVFEHGACSSYEPDINEVLDKHK